MATFAAGERDLGPPAHAGPGWAAAVEELNRRLWALRPSARAVLRHTTTGLPAIVLYDPARRPTVRAECERLERRLATICEHCGAPGALRAGVLLRVTCDGCEHGP
jgi:hypothetical protein